MILQPFEQGSNIGVHLWIPLLPEPVIARRRLPVLPQQGHDRRIGTNRHERKLAESFGVFAKESLQKLFLLCRQARAAYEKVIGFSRWHPTSVFARPHATRVK